MKLAQLILCGTILIVFLSCTKEESNVSILSLPQAASAIGSKEKPYARFEYEQRQLVDPRTNEIPARIHQKELEFTRATQKNIPTNGRRKMQDWILAGPENVGGRTRALAIDAENEEIILAGGVSGGIWRSENGGFAWSRTTQPNILNGVTSLIQDTRIGKRKNWYYGTGELLGNSARGAGAPYRGDGIFKSTDGGVSWDLLTSTSSNQPASFDSPFNYVWNLAMDPTNEFDEDEIYAAVYGNIVKSIDGGVTWEYVLGTPNLLVDTPKDLNGMGSFYTNILITKSGKYYAYLNTYINNLNETVEGGIFFSEDGKKDSWLNITPNGFTDEAERLVMSSAPSDESIIYFLVEGEQTQLWKHQNGSWSNRSNQIPNEDSGLEAFDSQGGYNMTIKVHPDDSDVVYIGGTNLYRSIDGYKSTANTNQIGGYDIENQNQIYPDHHPDQHELIFLAGSNEMLSANDGGIFKTLDNLASSVSWNSLNNGYITSQFYTVATSKVINGHKIIGGMQDNGTFLKSQDGESSNWDSVLNGDGSYCATTPNDLFWYMSFQEGAIFKISYNTDGSINSWAEVDPVGIHRSSYLFVAPFVMDPNNYNRMYLAGDSAIWRNDNLSQITPFKQNPTSTNWNIIDPKGDPQKITALDISTNPAHVLYYGTVSGDVYRTSKANSPNSTTKKVFSQEGYISNITIDPSNAERLLVCYSNYNIISLFFSQDGGQSFIDIGGNLEENNDGTGNGPSIRWSEIVPMSGGGYRYFLGTSTGLYSTNELIEKETIWQKEGINSIGNSVVTMMDYRSPDGKLVVATHGNGVFESTISNTKQVFSNTAQQEALVLSSAYPNPFKDLIYIKFSIPESKEVTILITDASGKNIRTLVAEPQFRGDVTVTWDGKNNNGALVNNGLYQYMIMYGSENCGGKILLSR